MIKIEITTCEQYVLSELKDSKNKIDELESQISELKQVSDNLYSLLCYLVPNWIEEVFGNGGKIPS